MKKTKKKATKKKRKLQRTTTTTRTKQTTVRTVKKNPAPARDTQAQVRQAVQRFTGFRGDAPTEVRRVKVSTPGVMLTMGNCLGIMYETVRDGRREKYLHRFNKKARPLLAVSSDGRKLYLIGGSYSVTDRGIEDAPLKR